MYGGAPRCREFAVSWLSKTEYWPKRAYRSRIGTMSVAAPGRGSRFSRYLARKSASDSAAMVPFLPVSRFRLS
jgi:hypothetical protein